MYDNVISKSHFAWNYLMYDFYWEPSFAYT